MIKLGSENFPVTFVSQKLISLSPLSMLNVLEIQDISCILSPIWPLECPKKAQKLVVSYWMSDSIKCLMKNYLHVQIFSFRGLSVAR